MLNIEEFKKLVSENLGVDLALLKNNTSFLDDLGIDSLSMVNFIIKLERKYQIKLDLNTVWTLRNVEDAYNLFSEKINEAQEIS